MGTMTRDLLKRIDCETCFGAVIRSTRSGKLIRSAFLPARLDTPHPCTPIRVTWSTAGSLTNRAHLFEGLLTRRGTRPVGSLEVIPSEEAGPTDDGKG